jgi:regulator of protease activity HflC (stomatin/prohibitin superfamily)
MARKTDDEFNYEATDQFRVINGLSFVLFAIIVGIGVAISYLTEQPLWQWILLVAGIAVLFSVKVVREWEKAIVLRFGRFHRVVQPGLFLVIPLVDSVAAWVDHRVMVTPFSAERTLTKDTVPVDVDAVLFWHVWDARKASLEVKNYHAAISWAAQTALRDIIGKMMLADILVGRESMDARLQEIIDERTTPWGVTVNSVEIRDIVIPAPLEDAMSRQAQAERERQARLILGEAEKQVAQSFVEAAELYEQKPTAFRLRSMNMLFEAMKERGSLIIVPSDSVNTLGTAYSIAATLSQEEFGTSEVDTTPPAAP